MIGRASSANGSIATATTISAAVAAIAASASIGCEEAAVAALAGALPPLAPSAPDRVRNADDDETRDADQYEAGEQLDHILAPSAVDTLKGNQR